MNFTFRKAMSRTTLLALVGFCAVAPSLSNAATTAKRFPTSNGAVKYRMTMNGKMAMNGNISMTWTNFGARFRQDSRVNMSMGAQKTTMNSWSLFDGKALYSALPNGIPGQPAGRKIALKMALPPNYLKSMAMGGASPANSMGRVVGRGNVLGKMCEIRAIDVKRPNASGVVKVWLWQKLPLRTETDMTVTVGKQSQNIKMSMVATQLDTNLKPNPALFRLPAGYTIKDMSAMQKQMMARQPKR